MNPLRSKGFWLSSSAVAVAGICVAGYNGLDMPLAEWMRSLPDGWHRAGKLFSDWGKGELYVVPVGVAAALFFWFVRRNRIRFHLALFSVAAVTGAGLLNSGLKFVFGRARPPRVWPDAAYDYGFHWFHGAKAAWQSFPSGHTISAAAAATALWFILPRWLRPFCVFYVAAMMASRMLANAHFLSDVVAAASLGVAFTLAIRHYMRKYKLF
jgi:membrane-associated phospholipid phosphatase